MKIPATPPDHWRDLLITRRSGELLSFYSSIKSPLVNGKYLHWDKLRFLKPPEGRSNEDWWAAIQFHREAQMTDSPILDVHGQPFRYLTFGWMMELLHQIDMQAGGTVSMPEQVTNPGLRNQYCVRSLIEEAITSSQIEGATTTRPVAKQMIRSGRMPRDESEQMILNNYHAMQRIQERKHEDLSQELVLELHRIMTKGTLKDESAAGRLRQATDADSVEVVDAYGTVLHTPPDAAELPERMKQMCDFANGKLVGEFIHPVIRSIMLHFWLAYDHPFVDGNGRTARALFYWSMLHHRYWLCEFISISAVIRKAQVQYGTAFLYTETDNNDLTYFLIYHLETIQKAVNELHAFINRTVSEHQKIKQQLRMMTILNHRQQALIAHAIQHPDQIYTIDQHRASHDVVYQTARQDLLDLVQLGLLTASKRKRRWHFLPVSELEARLSKLNPLEH